MKFEVDTCRVPIRQHVSKLARVSVLPGLLALFCGFCVRRRRAASVAVPQSTIAAHDELPVFVHDIINSMGIPLSTCRASAGPGSRPEAGAVAPAPTVNDYESPSETSDSNSPTDRGRRPGQARASPLSVGAHTRGAREGALQRAFHKRATRHGLRQGQVARDEAFRGGAEREGPGVRQRQGLSPQRSHHAPLAHGERDGRLPGTGGGGVFRAHRQTRADARGHRRHRRFLQAHPNGDAPVVRGGRAQPAVRRGRVLHAAVI